MNDNIEYAYIFKKINNKYYIITNLIKGIYDDNYQVFIGNNGKTYNYILFSNNEGFAIRNIINKDLYNINYLLKDNNYFYFDLQNNTFKLIWIIDNKKIICYDKDLNNFNFEYKKMYKKIRK